MRQICFILTKEIEKMSHFVNPPGSRRLAKKIWSAWMRFGSPRVSVQTHPSSASESTESANEQSQESQFDVPNEYCIAEESLA